MLLYSCGGLIKIAFKIWKLHKNWFRFTSWVTGCDTIAQCFWIDIASRNATHVMGIWAFRVVCGTCNIICLLYGTLLLGVQVEEVAR